MTLQVCKQAVKGVDNAAVRLDDAALEFSNVGIRQLGQ